MYYDVKVKDVFKALGSSKNGLDNDEAKKRLEQYGYNELEKEKKATVLILLLNQFKDFLILLLIFATIISLFLGEIIDAAAMFSIVMLAALLGFYQEYKAEKAIEALEKMAAPNSIVLRNGKEMKIPAKELVQGDIVILEEGDIMPADCRLIESVSLQVDEASLTGESVPSKKKVDEVKKDTPIAEQEDMAFMGTIVTYGKGMGIVTATGMTTELGKIAKSIQKTEEVRTPLQVKFEQMAKQIGFAVIILIIIVFLAGIMSQSLPISKLLIFALSLAVAAVPSSLPAIVTIGLSMGTKQLAKKNMIIKKLPAAESLGSATFICSDKTGTLTKNQMTITHLYTNNEIIDVSGSGYEPKGNFSEKGKIINPRKLDLLLRIGYLCNNAKLNENDGKWEVIGDPTEGSLIVLGEKGKVYEQNLKKFSLIDELPFDANRKRMSVVYDDKNNKKKEAYVKGAPDLLLNVCDRIIDKGEVRKITKKDKANILKINDSFADDALRVLGLAYKEIKKEKSYSIDTVEKNLVFVGLAGMIDPPREEVRDSIEKCKGAGIKVMVITGDHAKTAKAVANKIGLFNEGDILMNGSDIDKMNDKELEEKIENIRIIARALPIQKSRIIDALKKKGHIVAMTGDGVNDAPALKKADIGIAMGITGSGVAKEVSKAILVDDNFSSIVNAIGEGRNIYDKIIKSTRYLLSCNMGEITAVFLTILLRMPLPMIPLQILLMNLITDGLPALGLGFEPIDEDAMKRMPRNPKERPISKSMLTLIVSFGLIMGLGTLFLFNLYLKKDLILAQTVAFTTLVMFEMFAVIGSRSLKSFRRLNPFSNKTLLLAVLSSILIQIAVIYWQPLQVVFGTTALVVSDWLKILAVSSLGFIVMELSKVFIRDKEALAI